MAKILSTKPPREQKDRDAGFVTARVVFACGHTGVLIGLLETIEDYDCPCDECDEKEASNA